MKTILALACAVAILCTFAFLMQGVDYIVQGYGLHPVLALFGAFVSLFLARESFRHSLTR